MKKHCVILFRLFLFSLKSKLTYRVNLFFKLLYGPVYVGVLFAILVITYQETSTLAGWTRQEAFLLFAVFNLIYCNCLILFTDSIRYFLWTGIRYGEVDMWLLKPGSPQFFLTFSRPNTDFIALWLCVMGFFIYQLVSLSSLTLFNFIGFLILFILGHVIVYLSLSSYATLGFYVTRAQQIIEVFDKSTDFAQYPLPIFPQSLQFILSTFLPVAFFSYYPTQFLRGQGSVSLIFVSIFFTFFLFIINRLAWKYGLRAYSSASS